MNNTTEVLQHFKELGHEPYYRNGKLQGIAFEGETKYRFTTLGISPGE